MSDTAHPRFFEHVPMRLVRTDELDAILAADERLRILFLWGRDCPNCDIAKGEMLFAPERFRWPDVDWLHDNVYEDRAMAVRFGLHGIPTFMVFRGARKLGRITPWPGTETFVAAIERARAG